MLQYKLIIGAIALESQKLQVEIASLNREISRPQAVMLNK